MYRRSKYCDGRVIIRLIVSKTRVAPVKRQSIPRLELLGALIMARLTETISTSWGKVLKQFTGQIQCLLFAGSEMKDHGSRMLLAESVKFVIYYPNKIGDIALAL